MEQDLFQRQSFEVAAVTLETTRSRVLGFVIKHGSDILEDAVAKLALKNL